MSAAIDELLARLRRAEERLVEHAAAEDRGLPAGLTEPDPGGEERWEAGQVWAHVAEFPAYWLGELRRIVDAPSDTTVPFGRTADDPTRVGAIEHDRHTDPAALLARVRRGLADVTDFATGLPDAAWLREGRHPTRGDLPVQAIVERFLVSHLEQHADQLDDLRTREA